MNFFSAFLEMFRNSDQFIAHMSAEYGIYVYLFLFTVYFLETGIVICALLPGDSLIFVSGAASAAGILNPLGAFLAKRSVLVSEIPLHTESVTFSAARYTTAPLNGLTNSKWQKRRHFLPNMGNLLSS